MGTSGEIVRRALARLVTGEATPAGLLGVDAAVVNGLFALGLEARAQGRIDAAEGVFRRCLLLDPQRAEFWIALGAVRQAQGRTEEAGEVYQIAGLMTEDPAPVAYAAACFAQAGQQARARVLAESLRQRGCSVEHLAAWLAVAEA